MYSHELGVKSILGLAISPSNRLHVTSPVDLMPIVYNIYMY
jgi:hypothetical protein